jgi:hypothetical protein
MVDEARDAPLHPDVTGPGDPASDDAATVAAVTAAPIAWEHTGDGEIPYHARIGGRACLVRVNDFPAEPLYTLVVDGRPVADLEEWPTAWMRPPIPEALLERVARRAPRSPGASITRRPPSHGAR